MRRGPTASTPEPLSVVSAVALSCTCASTNAVSAPAAPSGSALTTVPATAPGTVASCAVPPAMKAMRSPRVEYTGVCALDAWARTLPDGRAEDLELAAVGRRLVGRTATWVPVLSSAMPAMLSAVCVERHRCGGLARHRRGPTAGRWAGAGAIPGHHLAVAAFECCDPTAAGELPRLPADQVDQLAIGTGAAGEGLPADCGEDHPTGAERQRGEGADVAEEVDGDDPVRLSDQRGVVGSQPVASAVVASVASERRCEPSSGTTSMVVPELVGTAATRRSPLGASAAEDAAGPRSVTPPPVVMATSSPVDVGVAVTVADAVGVGVAVAFAGWVAVAELVAVGAGLDDVVAGAVDDVATTVPSPPLISCELTDTEANACGESWVTEGTGGGVGAVPNEMWMSLAARDPPAERVALRSMVTVYGVLPAR